MQRLQVKEEAYRRHLKLPWFDNTMVIALVGVGSVGSWLAFLMARAGYKNIVLIDGDIVDTTNLAGQLFSSEDVGIHKVHAIKDFILEHSEALPQIYTRDSYLSEDTPSGYIDKDIIISAVDSMATRKFIFNIFKSSTRPKLLIDARLTLEQMQIYVVTRDEAILEAYEKTLFDDDPEVETNCSVGQTSHFSAGIAYNIIRCINNFVTNQKVTTEVKRTLPFFIRNEGVLFADTITTSKQIIEEFNAKKLEISKESNTVINET